MLAPVLLRLQRIRSAVVVLEAILCCEKREDEIIDEIWTLFCERCDCKRHSGFEIVRKDLAFSFGWCVDGVTTLQEECSLKRTVQWNRGLQNMSKRDSSFFSIDELLNICPTQDFDDIHRRS